jgi:hypothetical protein
MRSLRHIFLSLGMTSIEFDELMDLMLVAKKDSYPWRLRQRLEAAEKKSDPKLMWDYEEESPAVLEERGMCDEEGCENKAADDDEAPEGLCVSCRANYVWIPYGQPGYGWQKREDVT